MFTKKKKTVFSFIIKEKNKGGFLKAFSDSSLTGRRWFALLLHFSELTHHIIGVFLRLSEKVQLLLYFPSFTRSFHWLLTKFKVFFTVWTLTPDCWLFDTFQADGIWLVNNVFDCKNLILRYTFLVNIFCLFQFFLAIKHTVLKMNLVYCGCTQSEADKPRILPIMESLSRFSSSSIGTKLQFMAGMLWVSSHGTIDEWAWRVIS